MKPNGMTQGMEMGRSLIVQMGLIAGLTGGLTMVSLFCQPVVGSTPVPTSLPNTTIARQPSAIAGLARHLKAINAKMYGAYWCPHCNDQKALFGEDLFKRSVSYIECAPDGKQSQTARCRKAGIQGFPTWEIKGKLYPGTRSLEELAEISGYTGSRNF